ncbi:hypothetical protein HK103_000951 [Boothiomyces macroporosus]|uniref:adenosine deaminase n=1 Tax=Boothiomyces macroporosus TaxID=261099 RepID=A0AAD5UPI2_9FUNG|nr:hypothetical protein HK103_000951 [Boothiomyces macroporosus]
MQLQKIPKVELHNHLEGSIRLDTLKEIAIELKVKALENAQGIEPFKQFFCLDKPTDSLTTFLTKFGNIQAVLVNYDIVERIAFEVCEDAHLQGVVLLELRYSPHYISLGHSEMTLDGIHLAVMKGVEKARSKYGIAVGLIGILDRNSTLEEAKRVSDFFCKYKRDFVAVDLANDEKYDALQFKHVFENAKEHGLGVTIHAGEAGTSENVREAIEVLGATRIGHGVMILQDDKVVELAKAKNILLEVCPISNWYCGVVPAYQSHPIRKLLDRGLKVSINSDDAGIFQTSLLQDYEMLSKHFSVTEREFLEMNLNALEASFVDQQLKDQVYRQHFEPYLNQIN